MEKQICKKCNQEKLLSEFVKHSSTISGYLKTCKECRNKHLREKEGYKPNPILTHKVCAMCELKLPISNFYKNKHNIDGYNSYCKKCKQEYLEEMGYPEKYNKKRRVRRKTDKEWREQVNSKKRNLSLKDMPTKMLANAKQRAKKNNLDFDLQISDIIIPTECPILGSKLKPGVKGDYEFTPSIDKIDPTGGYTKSNVQIISKKANTMKNNASVEELVRFANWVLERYSLNYVNNQKKENVEP